MEKTEVRDRIGAGLIDLLKPHGFRFNKAEYGFVRRIPAGKQTIGIPLVAHNPVFDFGLVLTTRLDAVQDILNQFTGSPPRYHSITVTAITQLDWFTKGERTKWRIQNEVELDAAIAALRPIVSDSIVPFLDAHKDVSEWDAAVNSPSNDIFGGSNRLSDRTASVDNSNQPYRCMTALVLAKLADNPEFETIAASSLEFFKNASHPLGLLTPLVTHLRNSSTMRRK